MPIVDLTSIILPPDRQRELNRTHIGALRESILSKGLLHPPVVIREADGRYRLVAGAHRHAAIAQLSAEGIAFSFDGSPIPPGSIPITNVWDLSAADLMETELEENIIRLEIPWQDRVRALAAIHEQRRRENPAHTFTDTARELATKGSPVAERTARREVRNATILAGVLSRPEIAKARNATEALGILWKREEAKAEAALISHRKTAHPKSGAAVSLCEARLGDMRDVLPQLPTDEFDLIIADLPYGIGADSAGFRTRTVEHHNYDDTTENARALLQTVLSDGFRVLKGRANLFVFGDINLFQTFKSASAAMGFKPFRTPIIWRKSESEGLAPWGSEGFRRTYEMIFWATKGQKGLFLSPTDVLDFKRVSRSDRRYGPEKPVSLMKLLIECSTMPGDYVLDPCCGAGSTLIAARQLGRRALGIELDASAHALAVVAAERDPDVAGVSVSNSLAEVL
jgi:site-specific DNA-methyltransferase (adenine-specific)